MKRKNAIIKKCQNCGDEFSAMRFDAYVCSDKCRAAANRHQKKIRKMAKDIFGMLDQINQQSEKHGGWLHTEVYKDLKRSHEAIEYMLENHARQLDLFVYPEEKKYASLSLSSLTGEQAS
jgi:predicted nucleic acid-binding Zn ribbon protein